ncbi:MAG: DUF4393 domain-containing protein [Pseudonocardia sp.]|nr:DUF4393 domain-containing protein [Pseudonocardia sp.]
MTETTSSADTDGRHHRPSPRPRQPADAPAEEDAEDFVGIIRNAPRIDAADAIGVARVAGTAVWRAVNAVTRRSVGAAAEIARDVQSGEPVSDIIDSQVDKVRSAAVHALGLDGGARALLDAAPVPPPVQNLATQVAAPDARAPAARRITRADLRQIGNTMLRTSAYAQNQPKDEHPAFAAMIASLTPDEARILRFLAVAGAQPALDVRTKTPFGIGSERLAGGMNLIAEMAGCSYPDHDHEYLANLNRLGLVRFSEEPVADFRRYSLIEAQPKVAEVMELAKKATTVYRSIYLSLFGQQFCETCFDLAGYDAGGWATDDRGDKIIGRGAPKPRKKKHA